MTKSASKNTYTYAYGRRKSAVATVKLFAGKGECTVNTEAVSKYFPGTTAKSVYTKPFIASENENKYYFQAKVVGGGKAGQVEALALAIARSFVKLNPDYKSVMRQADLLTVDSRVRERRMVGTGGKARRQKQSPKR
jgi:small subunit ribosomal protein S9